MMSDVHPMPLPPSEFTYGIHFTVPAGTYLEAVDAAVSRLRRDVHLIAVRSATPVSEAYWDVVLKVWESSDD